MNFIAVFLGMSLSISGIGGLLSGCLQRSFLRAIFWATAFGLFETILLYIVSPTSRIVPIFILIAAVWGLIGWFTIGRVFARRRKAKAVLKKANVT